jgi:RecA-family ATPase
MTPQELLNNAGIFPPSYMPGRYYTACPKCSASRQVRHQKLKCLGITVLDDKVFWGCNHCGWTGPEKGSGIAGPDPVSYRYGQNLRKVRNTRSNGPKFYWQHLNGGGWEKGTNGLDTSSLLYRIDEVIEAMAAREPILIVEGERDVDTCWGLGFAATCNAHGAGKWSADHSTQLALADLIVLNDNDDQGRTHANTVCICSWPHAHSIKRLDLKVDWPGIPVGGDITDWVNEGGTAHELQDLIDTAPEWKGTPDDPKPPPLPFIRPGIWTGLPVPEQDWSVRDRIPAQQACLLSGHGGKGKSTIGLHLCSAHVLARDWLKSMPTPGPAFFLDAEDAVEVVHRRMEAIRQNYDTTFAALEDGGLYILPMAGEDVVMAVADRNGKIIPTPFYQRLLEAASDVKPVQIVIAPAAMVFAGNENDRVQVQQFVGLLTRIAIRTGGSVTLISHPSLTGLSTGTGISGTTQWHNAFRARMVVNGVEDDNGVDSGLRRLEFLKNQYGPLGESIVLKWQNGMFLPVPEETDFEKAAKEAKADQTFVEVAKKLQARGQTMSPNKTARNYAVHLIFGELPTDTKLTKGDLAQAMNRLLDANRIIVLTTGRTPYLRVP